MKELIEAGNFIKFTALIDSSFVLYTGNVPVMRFFVAFVLVCGTVRSDSFVPVFGTVRSN